MYRFKCGSVGGGGPLTVFRQESDLRCPCVILLGKFIEWIGEGKVRRQRDESERYCNCPHEKLDLGECQWKWLHVWEALALFCMWGLSQGKVYRR